MTYSIILTPTSSQPVVSITRGADTFRLTCAEAFGIGGYGFHATTDGVHYAGSGEWVSSGSVLEMHRVIPDDPAIEYTLSVEPAGSSIRISMRVKNNSSSAWQAPSWADCCLQMNPNLISGPAPTDMYDADGSHTYIPTQSGMLLVSQMVNPALQGNVAHFYKSGIAPQFPVCSGDAIVRTNASRNKWIAFSFDGSPGLFANFGQGNCIHSTPSIGPLEAGAELTRFGSISFGDAGY